MINLQRWDYLSGEIDEVKLTRFISGRITKKRLQKVSKLVNGLNLYLQAPYGVSERGYAYACGCDWDCCGCLVGGYINMSYSKDEIWLLLTLNYNY